MSIEQASVYIHIPFCGSFCDYCDFYSVQAKDNDEYFDKFIPALIADIKRQIEFFEVKEVITAYIGGGTPSVLGKKISALLGALRKIPGFSPKEFSVEANPESVTGDFLRACKDGGVNRLSAGVQTFHEPSRAAVNRGCESRLLEEKIRLISEYYKDAFSADLIIGLPFQNKQTAEEDIKKILEYAPSHVSLYSLSAEKGTPLENKIKTKDIILPDSETSDSLWLMARDMLLDAGFNHYEVSNFAKEGKECLHNIRYWNLQSWLGAGPSASGTIVNEKTTSARRFTFANDVNAYINSPDIKTAEYEDLDKNMLIRESILMGFRRKEGPDSEIFKKRFGRTAQELIPVTIKKWKNNDKDMLLFLNQFLLDAFTELDN